MKQVQVKARPHKREDEDQDQGYRDPVLAAAKRARDRDSGKAGKS